MSIDWKLASEKGVQTVLAGVRELDSPMGRRHAESGHLVSDRHPNERSPQADDRSGDRSHAAVTAAFMYGLRFVDIVHDGHSLPHTA